MPFHDYEKTYKELETTDLGPRHQTPGLLYLAPTSNFSHFNILATLLDARGQMEGNRREHGSRSPKDCIAVAFFS